MNQDPGLHVIDTTRRYSRTASEAFKHIDPDYATWIQCECLRQHHAHTWVTRVGIAILVGLAVAALLGHL